MIRGGVLEDVLGLDDVLEDTFWSPWPWPRRSSPWPSRPQVFENWPVLGSRTSLFFESLKFCGVLEKFFGKRFFVEIAWKKIFLEIAWKIFVKTFFFWRALSLGLEHSCPWPRECLSSERLSLALASDFFCVLGLGLEPCVLYSTSDYDYYYCPY